ncbi:hypothetical protein PIB30_102423 [Stylosanthes scabra]|uniref:Uncharacterized protein n=1 Tax=Stylosanthes scabra TaxID=79078 RepID=A0ABU6XYM1_9FABA|nr:hypothetical protein [Stylosanthes scabra]
MLVEQDALHLTSLLANVSSHNHCNFFLWLDRHLAMFGKKEQYSKGGEDEEDVSEHFAKTKLELRLADLEERVSAI